MCANNQVYCSARDEQFALAAILTTELVATAVTLGADLELTGPAEAARGQRLADVSGRLARLAEDAEKRPGLESPLRRGYAIGEMLWENLVTNFPTIDQWDARTATSIKSLDLSSKTYQTVSNLSSKLRGYVDDVSGFTATSRGLVTIRAGDVQARGLKVGIPDVVMSTSQEPALIDAADRALTLPNPLIQYYIIP